MRLLLLTGLVAAVSAPAFAQEAKVTGNVSIVTDYQWRNVTQSNEDWAVQGGLDFDSGMGFTAGAWASNVDFGDDDDTNVEIDLYGGYGFAAGGVDMKVGFIYYAYPDAEASDLDFYELNFAAGRSFENGLSLGGTLNWDPDNETIYVDGKVTYAFSPMFKIDGGVGTYLDGFGEYTGYNFGATFTAPLGFDLGLRFYDSDIAGLDEGVVLSIGRAM
jgi:uncharacterized protein (TIGR02001 family)